MKEVEKMKKVLILNGESTSTENYAIRDVLENFGYIVTIFIILIY